MADPLLSDTYLQLDIALYRTLGFYYDAISRLWLARNSGDAQQTQLAIHAVRVTAADAESKIANAVRHLQQLPQTEQVRRELEHLGRFQHAIGVQLKHLPHD
jgi:hypothetical protein